MEPCSNGTPRFNPNPSPVDASSRPDAAITDGATDGATSEGGAGIAIRGTVGEAIAMPRARAMDTRVAGNWSVAMLLDPSRSTTTSATGTFALGVSYDADGVAPLRVESVSPRRCGIGHARAGTTDVAVVAIDPAQLEALLLPVGFIVDSAKAQLVVEVEDSLRMRASNVSVTVRPGTVEGVAYDIENTRFALGAATSTQGTALLTNVDFVGPTAKVDLVLTRDGRTRSLPIYFARGCTTFVTALAP